MDAGRQHVVPLVGVVHASGGYSSQPNTLHARPQLVTPQGADDILSPPYDPFWVPVCRVRIGLPRFARDLCKDSKAVHRGIADGYDCRGDFLTFRMHLFAAGSRGFRI
ncbi:hypothetical protein KCP69_05590 [Salmonella enterica subsp. enterica]|nr:hypothetical protein KCP69_05590 [Salmonella enterica subsp. enterica]